MKISITAILALGVAIQACSPSIQTNNSIVVPSGTTIDNIEQPVVIGTKKQMAYPKAVIYKTNGNFSNNVPITLSADSKKLISFPAPSDITEQTAPIKLSQGYWLDRRGISPNTAFTKFTYRQYAAKKHAISQRTEKSDNTRCNSDRNCTTTIPCRASYRSTMRFPNQQ